MATLSKVDADFTKSPVECKPDPIVVKKKHYTDPAGRAHTFDPTTRNQ